MNNDYEKYRNFLKGDDDLLVELIQTYKDGLIFYLDSFTHDIYMAEKLVLETFVKIAIQNPTILIIRQFKIWLYKTAHSLALELCRKSQNTF